MATGDPVLARRAATATICESAARTVIDRVVAEAVSAANRFGLTRERATAYYAGIESTLPVAFASMRLADSPERTAGIDQLAAKVRAVSDTNHVPRIVERGLTAIAIRIAREVVRHGAAAQGFTADELEAEFTSFTDQLEQRLFRG